MTNSNRYDIQTTHQVELKTDDVSIGAARAIGTCVLVSGADLTKIVAGRRQASLFNGTFNTIGRPTGAWIA